MPKTITKYERRVLWLKRWIWVYFWLLIFEGVLRKWIVPSLSGPLLLVRDPVAVMIYIQAYRCQKFSMKTMWPFALLAAGMFLLASTQVVLGINTIPIAIYGLRSYLLHLPLIFVIADTLTSEDLHKFGRWLLFLAIPMTILVLAQFRAGVGAWLNAGAGEGAAQIMSVGGHVRPAGTFSYDIGPQNLIVLTFSFILYALMRKGTYPTWLVYSALFAAVASVPILGSRTVLFTMVILGAFTLYSGMSHAARLAGLVKIAAVFILAGVIAIQLPFFQDAVSTMEDRWQQASKSEGDVGEVLDDRILGNFEGGIQSLGATPWLGSGIGMGSNFAAVTMTGKASFMMGEGEWVRIIPEFGPICGLLFMGVRMCFVGYLFLVGLQGLRRKSALGWLLLPAVAPLLIMGVMEQPTYLGFMVFDAGLCLAAAQAAKASLQTRPAYSV